MISPKNTQEILDLHHRDLERLVAPRWVADRPTPGVCVLAPVACRAELSSLLRLIRCTFAC